MSTRVEIVSEDLASHLPVCPVCHAAPIIFKRLIGLPLHPQVAITCPDCDGYENGIFREVSPLASPWHDSLYLAVSVWTTYAKLAGSGRSEQPLDAEFYYPPNSELPWNA